MADLVIHDKDVIGVHIPVNSDKFVGMSVVYDYMKIKLKPAFVPSLEDTKILPGSIFYTKTDEFELPVTIFTNRTLDSFNSLLEKRGSIPEFLNTIVPNVTLEKPGLFSNISGYLFTIVAVGDTYVKRMDELYGQIGHNNLSLFYSYDDDPSSFGLTLFRIDKVPDVFKDQLSSIGESKARLHKEFNSTGIVQKLIDNRCEWLSLSPRWVSEEEDEIIVWLKPRNTVFHSGWYSVDDLLAWIDGTGPVVDGKVNES